jgi:hypothetical protein
MFGSTFLPCNVFVDQETLAYEGRTIEFNVCIFGVLN